MLIKPVDDKSRRIAFLLNLYDSPMLNAEQKKWLDDELWSSRRKFLAVETAAGLIDACFGESNDFAVLHDLRLRLRDGGVRIDHLLLARTCAFIIETRSFEGNITIDVQGDFTVQYSDGTTRTISTPLKRGLWLAGMMQEFLTAADIKARGAAMPVHHLLMLPEDSAIRRPQGFDSSNVIKPGGLKSWIEGVYSHHAAGKLKFWAREKDSLREWAEKIVSLHHPDNPFYLPKSIRPPKRSKTAGVEGEAAATDLQPLEDMPPQAPESVPPPTTTAPLAGSADTQPPASMDTTLPPPADTMPPPAMMDTMLPSADTTPPPAMMDTTLPAQAADDAAPAAAGSAPAPEEPAPAPAAAEDAGAPADEAPAAQEESAAPAPEHEDGAHAEPPAHAAEVSAEALEARAVAEAAAVQAAGSDAEAPTQFLERGDAEEPTQFLERDNAEEPTQFLERADDETPTEFLEREETPAPAPEPAPAPQPAAAPAAPPGVSTCALCGRPLMRGMVDFCRKHPKRFGGQLYCFTHQDNFPPVPEEDA